MELKIPVWTASQVNRGALDKPMIGPSDLAEDISQFWTLDFLIAICQTKEEKGTQQDRDAGKPEKGRLLLASARDVGSGAIIAIEIQRKTLSIRETGFWLNKEVDKKEKENPYSKKKRGNIL